ncbi:MAG TPA: hypothetical protein VKW04_18225 [Planctomycetota bacterium]|nr:hypothetical protein [Planctomycetota bacterium]
MGLFNKPAPPSEWDPSNAGLQNSDLQLQAAQSKKFTRARTDRMKALAVGTIAPQSADQANKWTKLPYTEIECLFQLTTGGQPVTHPVYLAYAQPADGDIALGKFIPNAAGQAFMLAEGYFWVYVPQQTGDPASFGFTITDVSSQLPAQQSAIAGQTQGTSVQTVQTLNRADFQTDNLLVVTSGTPIQYGTSIVVPTGFAVAYGALPSNTKNVYVAKSSARALKTAGHAQVLGPGAPGGGLYIANWNQLWIDADVSGEGIWIAGEI